MAAVKRALTLDDFWSLKTVHDVQLSPDGKTVAYVMGSYDERTSKQHSAIFLLDLDSRETRQLTSGEATDSQPRWSPDGARLAFVSTRHEGTSHIFIIDVRGGEPHRLTSEPEGAHTPVWSPDGRQICFSSTVETERQKVPQEVAWYEAHPEADRSVPRLRRQHTLMSRFDEHGYIDHRTHLFLLNVDEPGAAPRQLTEGDYDNLEPAWSPDGALIAFMSNRVENAEHTWGADVWTVSIDRGELCCLTNGDLTAISPSWSPDGQTIAFYAAPEIIANGYHDVHLWAVSRRGGDQRDLSMLIDLPRARFLPDYMWPGLTPPAWSPDGKTMYFLLADHGDGAIYRLELETGELRRVSPRSAVVTSACCTPDGSSLICLAATPTTPYDVCSVPTAGGELSPLTNSNAELLSSVSIVAPEPIAFKAPDDWEIEGWLFRPVDEEQIRPYPLILHVHGGPQGAFGNIFYFQAQTLAGAGYASLYINPRGSVGYGDAFARAADWGEKDFLDLMVGVDAVLARGEVDERRLGVTGLSYGGFMTNWIVGHSDRFAAAVSINGISNLISFAGVSDIGPLWAPIQIGGNFWESEDAWERYRYHSPITYVGSISTPLLLVQAENDYRCAIEQGEQMLNALRMRRQTVELIRVPGASHVIFTTPAPLHRYFERKLTQDWFDTYLKGEGPTLEVSEEEAGVVVEPTPVS